MTPLNAFLTALRGLGANKLRAALTTLGLIIGVASVITMLALGNGARASVEASFRLLGSDSTRLCPYNGARGDRASPVGGGSNRYPRCGYGSGARLTGSGFSS